MVVKPVSQGLQTLSSIESPIVARYEPGEHTMSGVHIAAFWVALKVPLGHVVHTGRELVPPASTK